MSLTSPPPRVGLPRRVSLVAQTVNSIREAIAAGHWRGRLPGERDLCETLQISRYTLRAALADLKQAGLLTTRARGHHAIQAKATSQPISVPDKLVVVLTRNPLRQITPTALLMIDALREYLSRSGWAMEIQVSAACFSAHPDRALEALVARTPAATWAAHYPACQIRVRSD